MIISILNRISTSKLICFILIFIVFFCTYAAAEDAGKEKDMNMDSPFGVLEFLNCLVMVS